MARIRITLLAALLTLPVTSPLAQSHQESFLLEFQAGNPQFQGFDLPFTSPNIFDLMWSSGIDIDQMLQYSNTTVDAVLAGAGISSDAVLAAADISADTLLLIGGRTRGWLLEAVGGSADWVLSHTGNSIDWLLVRTGGTADQLLIWAEKDSDWLLGRLGKDADWILDQSGKSVSWMLGATGNGTAWVAGVVKDIACGSLSGKVKDGCEAGVDLVDDSIAKLLGKVDKTAQWWLDKAGKDAAWLIAEVNKSNAWMLHQAGRTTEWLWNELGYDADWLLEKSAKTYDWLVDTAGVGTDAILQFGDKSTSWLFNQLGGTVDWLLTGLGREADWLFDQLGWRLTDAELRYTFRLQMQVVTGNGASLWYPGASRFDYMPGTPMTPTYRRRIGVTQGRTTFAMGLGAFNNSVTATYVDPAGFTLSQSADLGVFNQDLAITFDETRQLMSRARHDDDWLVTLCVPLSEILAALLAELPPASAAALSLVPDIMMQFNGDGGLTFNDETIRPTFGNPGDIVRLGRPQRQVGFDVLYNSNTRFDYRLDGGSYGFAWGLLCGPGVGVSMGYQIPGGYALAEYGPVGLAITSPVLMPLPPPSDMGTAPPPPRAGQPPIVRPSPGGTITAPSRTNPATAPVQAPQQQQQQQVPTQPGLPTQTGIEKKKDD